jgi:hypothetical protein
VGRLREGNERGSGERRKEMGRVLRNGVFSLFIQNIFQMDLNRFGQNCPSGARKFSTKIWM